MAHGHAGQIHLLYTGYYFVLEKCVEPSAGCWHLFLGLCRESLGFEICAGCPGDCAFADVACPGPPADAPCSGVGLCLSPSGACACWVGYDGADCSLCAEGYMRCGPPTETI